MKALDRISHFVNTICKHIIVYLLIIISAVIFIQVVARFVFDTGTFWTDELARFSLVWLVLLGAAVAVREKALINVDILENIFPSWSKILLIIQLVITLVFCGCLLKVGWETMWLVAAQRSPNMGVQMSVVYAAIPIGMLLMIIHLIVHLFHKKDQGGEIE